MRIMPDILPDPDFIGFDGVYVGGEKRLPPSQYNLSKMAKYLRDNKKEYSDLTDEEKAMFLL